MNDQTSPLLLLPPPVARQDLATAERRYGSDVRYTYKIERCLCYGQRTSVIENPALRTSRPPLDTRPTAPREHRVLVAFLRYKNHEYMPERSMWDYTLLPMNWLTVVLTGRPWIHVQLVFWDEMNKQYRTFSVDSKRNVHVYDKKGFADASWDFIELRMTEEQEIKVHNFCVDQLGKPMNLQGQLAVLFMPVSGGGQSWFCSEFVCAALDSAGLIDYGAWRDVLYPAAAMPHSLYDYLKVCTRCAVEVLNHNPVVIVNVYKAAKANGPVPIPTAEDSLSVWEHAQKRREMEPVDIDLYDNWSRQFALRIPLSPTATATTTSTAATAGGRRVAQVPLSDADHEDAITAALLISRK